MIKHLTPRSEKEIFENLKERIVNKAFEKIHSHGNTISYNHVTVYLNSCDLENDYLYDPTYFYEVTFKSVANHWELVKIEKQASHYMNKNWYTTQNLADGNPMKRPYDIDPMPYQQFIIRPHD